MIKNMNTIEDYRNLDKNAMLSQVGRTVSLHTAINLRLTRLGLGSYQRWNYLLVSLLAGIILHSVFRGPEEVQVHLLVWLSCTTFGVQLVDR